MRAAPAQPPSAYPPCPQKPQARALPSSCSFRSSQASFCLVPRALVLRPWALSPCEQPTTVHPEAHLSSGFTGRTGQARRTHGAGGTSVTRCTRSSLLTRLTLEGQGQGQ